MGDAAGIGPELIIKAFSQDYIQKRCTAIVYGASKVLNFYRKELDLPRVSYNIINSAQEARPGKLNLLECIPNPDRIEIGVPGKAGAQVAYEALVRAIADAQHGDIDAMVTLPVDKATLGKFLPEFKGHTGILGEAFATDDPLMMMVSEEMRVGMVTHHIPLKDVSQNISIPRILDRLKVMQRSLHHDFSISKGRIAVLGLNPHAGDNGLLGSEDQEIIAKAIVKAKEMGMAVEGPYPSDGFFGSQTFRKFDAVLAMYHDQGLIPFKLLSGYRGVNFTAGMPLVRTSPDHGVAYNIAGKGIADPISLVEAIYLAMDVHQRRAEIMPLVDKALPSVQNPDLKAPEPKA